MHVCCGACVCVMVCLLRDGMHVYTCVCVCALVYEKKRERVALCPLKATPLSLPLWSPQHIQQQYKTVFLHFSRLLRMREYARCEG